MKEILSFYKKRGETPLQALFRLREENPEYAHKKLSYAGRLDPLAEGLIIVLVDEANKERLEYLGLDKVYETEILFGISTDTGDVLGKVIDVKQKKIGINETRDAIDSFYEEYEQKYPNYSSKTVGGRQLHEISRRGEKAEIPKHKVKIKNASIENIKKISNKDVLKYVLDSVDLVEGDFRQKEIKNDWITKMAEYGDVELALAKLKLSVSSGFYVRQFAIDLGEKLGIPALAYSIKRTVVGEYSIDK